MRYSPKQYAHALLLAIADKSYEARRKILRHFLSLVSKKGDSARLGLIIRETEKQYLRHAGLKKVILESPEKVPAGIKKEVEKILGKGLLIQEKINPRILAGIRILVNDALLLDASAEAQLRKLFP